MRGLKRDRTASVIMHGLALMQNVHRGHYELEIDARAHRSVAVAFIELARVTRFSPRAMEAFVVNLGGDLNAVSSRRRSLIRALDGSPISL